MQLVRHENRKLRDIESHSSILLNSRHVFEYIFGNANDSTLKFKN